MAAAKKETDNYVSEYDWIQIREKMEEGMKPETFLGKLSRKFSENPLVPMGIIALKLKLAII
jgi:hypothetical protein